jgi:predicted nucleic acid-binding protein
MIIVSDTTTVANLFAIGQFHLLPALFETIILPKSVYQELTAHNGFPNETEEQVRIGVLRVRAATNMAEVHHLMLTLDAGEAEAIALAEELHADTLIIDERKGRKIARERGLHTIELLGIVLEAKRYGFVPKVRPLLNDLRLKAGFYFSDSLYRTILDEAGETE